jgi:hypothetical protein
MFFSKKKENSEQNDKQSGNLDKIITWLIIWWAAASLLWLSKTKKWKEITTWIKNNSTGIFKRTYWLFWRSLVKIISIFNKKK